MYTLLYVDGILGVFLVFFVFIIRLAIHLTVLLIKGLVALIKYCLKE